MPMKPHLKAHILDVNQKSAQAMNDQHLKPETRDAAKALNQSTQKMLDAEPKQWKPK